MKTDALFTVSSYKVTVRSGVPFRLVFWGDVHRDSPSHADGAWQDFLKYAKSIKHSAYFIGMGDYCIPMDAEILTRAGFKTLKDLVTGEDVLAYDIATDTTKWTPLLGAYLSPQQPMLSLSSRSFRAVCTPGHAWYVHNPTWDKKQRIQRIEAKALKTHHRIIVAAQNHESGASKLTPNEAAMIGWIVTDGHCAKRNLFKVSVCQSAKKHLVEVRRLFGKTVTGEYTSKDNDCVTFNISTKCSEALFRKAGFTGKHDLPGIVGQLSEDSRKAMMDAMLLAEGWKERGHWRFAQKPGPVLDAFCMLCALAGLRVGMPTKNKAGVVSIRILSRSRRFAGVADMSISAHPKEDAWCPMTKHRSFVMRHSGQITITGNTDSTSTSERKCLATADLHESTLNDLQELAASKVKLLANELSFMKGRLIGLLNGNHYFNFSDGTNSDNKLCAALDCKYLGVSAFVRLVLRPPNGGTSRTLDVWLHHGSGGSGRLLGGSINKVDQMREHAEADVYAMGHDHKRGCVPATPRLFLDNHSAIGLRVCSRQQWLCRTGSFLASYTPGERNYNVDAGRGPCSLGHVELIITPKINAGNMDWTIRGMA